MITELMSAMSSVKTVRDMLGTALDANAFNRVNDVLIAMNEKMIAAQERIFGLQAQTAALSDETVAYRQKIRDLEAEIARLIEWKEERANYRLAEVATGAFAYVLQAASDEKERPSGAPQPTHWLCCQCYDASHKSILQFAGWDGSHRVHACHRCKARILERVESAGVTVQTVGRGRNRLDGFL